ncbi:MAG TPA: hypothetical protein DCL99_00945, partial [Firmicutes bacterium]|nr:hypothetical protein [Bacillota bacterium]
CRSTGQLLAHPEQVIHDAWYNPKTLRWYERHMQLLELAGGRLARLELSFAVNTLSGLGEGAYWRLILESIGDGVIATDRQGVVTMINPQAEKLTGWDRTSAVGKKLGEVFRTINTQTRLPVADPVDKVLATGQIAGLANHTSLLSRDGVEYQIADSAAPVKDSEGRIHGAILVFRDVSEEYRQREALRRSEERFRTLVETSINAIALHEIITDEEGRPVDYRFLEVNRAFEQLTGLSAEKLIGRTVLEVLPGTEPFWIETYGRVALTGEPAELEDFSRELGRYYSVRAYSPRPGRFVTVFEDITERRLMENRLREMVYRDFLTGLHNRRYLETQKDRWEGEENLPLSVVIGDLNGLKIINDSMGHQKGDEYLQQAAEIFQAVSRPGDLVIRWGGDEFVLLLARTDAEEAQQICARIDELSLQSGAAALSIALGSATKACTEETLADVLREAESRMYQQKISSAQSRRSALVLSLQQALAEKSHETEEHARSLQRLAVSLAQRVGLSDAEVVTVSLVALLHDIGKLAISESILDKPGPLSEAEWEAMRRHCEIGHRIVASSPDLVDVAVGVLHHHERWDGKGYPRGLKGEEIPIASRIVALADAFDAMTSDRPYRAALSLEEAKAEIARQAGLQFDPYLTQEFLAMLP